MVKDKGAGVDGLVTGIECTPRSTPGQGRDTLQTQLSSRVVRIKTPYFIIQKIGLSAPSTIPPPARAPHLHPPPQRLGRIPALVSTLLIIPHAFPSLSLTPTHTLGFD
ncbi:hypothetical protein Cpir12675_004957 [Ceratocystis pirilliformis]|uniref:Uncharacterized protein n=1 Tax=Ceratocystis pirilliformis TaxID=259994 RepID=A0ABR3YU80_9PEZI